MPEKYKYWTFIRSWWRENPDWPNGLEPCAGDKEYINGHDSEYAAREECREYARTHEPGRLSVKMEYEESK
jgi:hypothetical protein